MWYFGCLNNVIGMLAPLCDKNICWTYFVGEIVLFWNCLSHMVFILFVCFKDQCFNTFKDIFLLLFLQPEIVDFYDLHSQLLWCARIGFYRLYLFLTSFFFLSHPCT